MKSYPNQDSPESEHMHLKEWRETFKRVMWREWEWPLQEGNVARMRPMLIKK
jgi:hypothetical protein